MEKIPDGIWQQDGHTGHTVGPVMEFLDETVPILVWPSKSPDLSIIENVWSVMKARLAMMNIEVGEVQSQSQLEERMHTIWDGIEPIIIENLFNSLPRRMQAVIQSNGLPINY